MSVKGGRQARSPALDEMTAKLENSRMVNEHQNVLLKQMTKCADESGLSDEERGRRKRREWYVQEEVGYRDALIDVRGQICDLLRVGGACNDLIEVEEKLVKLLEDRVAETRDVPWLADLYPEGSLVAQPCLPCGMKPSAPDAMQISTPEEGVPVANVAGTQDTAPVLPIVDGHCHIFGQELFRNREALKKALKAAGIVGGEDSRFGKLRLFHHITDDSAKSAKHVLDAVPQINMLPEGEYAKAIVPLLLDMGYTPLNIPKLFESVAGSKEEGELIARSSYDDVFYGSEEKHIWFDRHPETFRGTIRTLSQVAASFPGQIFPMVPFDPRRPNGLDFVKHAINNLGFVGVKLYSRCGWMPLGNREMYGNKSGGTLDERLRELYTYLVDLHIHFAHVTPTSSGLSGVERPTRRQYGVASVAATPSSMR